MKIFYHNDIDGHLAAAIAAYKVTLMSKLSKNDEILSTDELSLLHDYETRSMFMECDYASNSIDPSVVVPGEDVYIVDYSFSPKTVHLLIEICNKAKHVTWIDHHVTSVRTVDEGLIRDIINLTSVIDIRMCGAALTWEHLVDDGILPKFVEFVDDYDCWKKQLGEQSDYFKIGVDMVDNYPWSELWFNLITDAYMTKQLDVPYGIPSGYEYTNTIARVLSTGRTVMQYIINTNKKYFTDYHFVNDEVFGKECVCVNWKTNSWVFGEAYNTYPLCCVFAFNGSVWSYSLYSHDPNIDCSAIAQKYGGGGHKGAAGFSLDYCLFDKQSSAKGIMS